VFAKAVNEVKDAEAQSDGRMEKFFDLFDLFGTHYFHSLTLGSKFTLSQTFTTEKWKTLTDNTDKRTTQAEVGLKINFLKKKKAKQKKQQKKGCEEKNPPLKRQDGIRKVKRDKDPCVQSTMDWIKEAWGLMLYKIKEIEIKTKVKVVDEESDLSNLEGEDESFSRDIVSIGAPPSEDPLEWAQQTYAEAMPIKCASRAEEGAPWHTASARTLPSLAPPPPRKAFPRMQAAPCGRGNAPCCIALA